LESQIIKAGQWQRVSSGIPVSPTNKTVGHHDITEVLYEVALDTHLHNKIVGNNNKTTSSLALK